jgi:hypothetical protein
MRITFINFSTISTFGKSIMKKGIIYLLYWLGYLLLFSLIEGLPSHDLFTSFKSELVSLVPKAIFVTLVVEVLADNFFLKRNIARFCTIYIALLIGFAFVLRLADNYIILKYLLIHWEKEPLLSAAPFLYNAIKLQFLVTIPFLVKLYGYYAEEKIRLQQAQTEANHYLGLFNEAKLQSNTTSPKTDAAFIQVKCDRRMMKIPVANICYFEAQGNYIFIYTLTGMFKAYLAVSELEEQLPGPLFIRVHRSFIVAVDKVESFTSTHVIVTDKKIPIGRSYSSKAKAALQIREAVV